MKRFSGLSKEETLKDIIKYLNEQIDLAERQSLEKDAYKDPSWAFLQADIIGQKRTLRKVLRYINNE